MKLNDEAVLEPLHLETADLSSGRRFIKEAASQPSEKPSNLTPTVLEFRREIAAGNEPTNGPSTLTRTALEFRGILSPPPPSALVKPDEQSAEDVATYERGLEKFVPHSSVVWVPTAPLDRDSFDVLQKFEGTVLSVRGDSFVARLVDQTKPGPEEEAEIPLIEVMPGDRELIKPGAVFYWVIGYERKAYGQVLRSSIIRFRRIPTFSPTEVERAKKAAETFLSFLDLERANNPA